MKLLLVAWLCFWAQGQVLIRNAWLVDGTGAEPRSGDVLIRDGRIAGLGQRLTVPPGAQVIDAHGRTLLPGLFDLHTHVAAGGDWLKNLMTYAWSGVTTVVDLGAYPEQYEPVRRILAERAWAPHLLEAARFSTPGGHGMEGGRSDFHTQAVLTPREARAAFERIAPYKPDIVKVFTDGWRYGTDVDMTSMDEATLAALVAEAHQHGLKVITHTVTLARGEDAARAGVDIIGHGLGDQAVDDDWIRLMKSHGTGYVQTLAVYEPRGGTASPARKKRWGVLLENTRRARQAGVLLGAGTDAGMPGTPHGRSLLHELELLVEGGLTPLEALAAATGNSARLLGVDGERGFLREGFAADLALVEGKPFEDIHAIHRVTRVWIGGREVDRPALAKAIASEDPVPLAPASIGAALDDFEREDGRSRLDTLWLNSTDPGQDHTRMIFERTERTPGDHVLTVLAEMAEKDAPHASVVLPLTRGAIVPADVRAWRGIELDLRGSGETSLLILTRGRREPRAKLPVSASWQHVRVAFESLENASGWARDNLLALEFRLARPAGAKAWLEIDNLSLYK